MDSPSHHHSGCSFLTAFVSIFVMLVLLGLLFITLQLWWTSFEEWVTRNMGGRFTTGYRFGLGLLMTLLFALLFAYTGSSWGLF